MSALSHSQTTTIEIILPQDRKTILEKAATLEGLSLSEYLLKIATDLAEQSREHVSFVKIVFLNLKTFLPVACCLLPLA